MNRARLIIPLFLLSVMALMSNSACVKLSRHTQLSSSLTATAPTLDGQTPLININTATRKELESLPGIGEGIATLIIEHRERHGAFRRTEHLLMVRGISERRFEDLRDRVSVN